MDFEDLKTLPESTKTRLRRTEKNIIKLDADLANLQQWIDATLKDAKETKESRKKEIFMLLQKESDEDVILLDMAPMENDVLSSGPEIPVMPMENDVLSSGPEIPVMRNMSIQTSFLPIDNTYTLYSSDDYDDEDDSISSTSHHDSMTSHHDSISSHHDSISSHHNTTANDKTAKKEQHVSFAKSNTKTVNNSLNDDNRVQILNKENVTGNLVPDRENLHTSIVGGTKTNIICPGYNSSNDIWDSGVENSQYEQSKTFISLRKSQSEEVETLEVNKEKINDSKIEKLAHDEHRIDDLKILQANKIALKNTDRNPFGIDYDSVVYSIPLDEKVMCSTPVTKDSDSITNITKLDYTYGMDGFINPNATGTNNILFEKAFQNHLDEESNYINPNFSLPKQEQNNLKKNILEEYKIEHDGAKKKLLEELEAENNEFVTSVEIPNNIEGSDEVHKNTEENLDILEKEEKYEEIHQKSIENLDFMEKLEKSEEINEKSKENSHSIEKVEKIDEINEKSKDFTEKLEKSEEIDGKSKENLLFIECVSDENEIIDFTMNGDKNVKKKILSGGSPQNEKFTNLRQSLLVRPSLSCIKETSENKGHQSKKSILKKRRKRKKITMPSGKTIKERYNVHERATGKREVRFPVLQQNDCDTKIKAKESILNCLECSDNYNEVLNSPQGSADTPIENILCKNCLCNLDKREKRSLFEKTLRQNFTNYRISVGVSLRGPPLAEITGVNDITPCGGQASVKSRKSSRKRTIDVPNQQNDSKIQKLQSTSITSREIRENQSSTDQSAEIRQNNRTYQQQDVCQKASSSRAARNKTSTSTDGLPNTRKSSRNKKSKVVPLEQLNKEESNNTKSKTLSNKSTKQSTVIKTRAHPSRRSQRKLSQSKSPVKVSPSPKKIKINDRKKKPNKEKLDKKETNNNAKSKTISNKSTKQSTAINTRARLSKSSRRKLSQSKSPVKVSPSPKKIKINDRKKKPNKEEIASRLRSSKPLPSKREKVKTPEVRKQSAVESNLLLHSPDTSSISDLVITVIDAGNKENESVPVKMTRNETSTKEKDREKNDEDTAKKMMTRSSKKKKNAPTFVVPKQPVKKCTEPLRPILKNHMNISSMSSNLTRLSTETSISFAKRKKLLFNENVNLLKGSPDNTTKQMNSTVRCDNSIVMNSSRANPPVPDLSAIRPNGRSLRYLPKENMTVATNASIGLPEQLSEYLKNFNPS